jgi:protein-disulfide isomerase
MMGRTSSWAPELVLPVSPERDHIRGNLDAPVTLVEYGDFECPYCGAAYPVVRGLEEQLPDVLRVVYRHFPISTVHPHAEKAAEASEAAGAQGRFWEMHDKLFENQDSLAMPDLHRYAEALDLDVGRFDDELMRAEYAPRVREDFMSGVRSGVNGTPTFYINGVRHDAGFDPASLVSAIQRAA